MVNTLDLGLTFKNFRTFLSKTALYRSSPPSIAITHPTSTSVSPTIKSFLPLEQNQKHLEFKQSLDCKVFCRTCQETTYREVRYRSDFQFVGRLLVCQSCGETILEPVGSG